MTEHETYENSEINKTLGLLPRIGRAQAREALYDGIMERLQQGAATVPVRYTWLAAASIIVLLGINITLAEISGRGSEKNEIKQMAETYFGSPTSSLLYP